MVTALPDRAGGPAGHAAVRATAELLLSHAGIRMSLDGASQA